MVATRQVAMKGQRGWDNSRGGDQCNAPLIRPVAVRRQAAPSQCHVGFDERQADVMFAANAMFAGAHTFCLRLGWGSSSSGIDANRKEAHGLYSVLTMPAEEKLAHTDASYRLVTQPSASGHSLGFKFRSAFDNQHTRKRPSFHYILF
jgi:hypothetical protein